MAATPENLLNGLNLLLALDGEADKHLTIGVRMRDARRLSGAGGGFVAANAIARIDRQLNGLSKAIVDRIRACVSVGAGEDDHITVSCCESAGCQRGGCTGVACACADGRCLVDVCQEDTGV